MDIYFDDKTLELLRKHLDDVQILEFNGYVNHFEVAHLLTKCVNKVESLQTRLNNAHDREHRYRNLLEESIDMVKDAYE